MDRRDTIKTLVAGSLASGFMLTGCLGDNDKPLIEREELEGENYGRTIEEAKRDREIESEVFFSEEEMQTITILSDIIIPADDNYGSATEAEVPEFIEFITKDIPEHKTPLRGGIRWINHESNRRYNKLFNSLTKEEQLAIIDDIAYPDEVQPQFIQGANFFSRMRNLVATGYFTSKIGLDYLGYQGNVPNVWDGVPQDVLDKHNIAYEEDRMDSYIKPEERNDIMQWNT